MKNSKALDCIGYVDAEFIEKAENYTTKKKRSGWLKWSTLAACFCILVVGVATIMHATSMHENDSISNQLVQDEQPSKEVEMLSCVFNSIDEMVSHIKAISSESSTDPIERSVKLESLTYFYAPTASVFPGYQLFQIEVLPDYIIYYFTPSGEKEEGFNYDSGITVTYCRYDDITLSSLSTQLGVKITDNEFLYDSKRGDISFMAETSVITIHVPKSLNDYPNLKSVCSVEKIIIE